MTTLCYNELPRAAFAAGHSDASAASGLFRSAKDWDAMNRNQDSPNGGATVQDVMSAWIVYAFLLAALAVCAFAFDFTASVADRVDAKMASQPRIEQLHQSPAGGAGALTVVRQNEQGPVVP